MAKRPARSLIKLKPKKEKKTRSEVYMVNLKYLGDEPTYKPCLLYTSDAADE